MKPIFCGNLEYDARQSDVERLFRRYGKVDRVDLKSGLLGMPMLLLDGWALLHFFSSICPDFAFLCFSGRTNLICNGTTILHSLRHHCLFIPHDLCSVLNIRHVST